MEGEAAFRSRLLFVSYYALQRLGDDFFPKVSEGVEGMLTGFLEEAFDLTGSVLAGFAELFAVGLEDFLDKALGAEGGSVAEVADSTADEFGAGEASATGEDFEGFFAWDSTVGGVQDVEIGLTVALLADVLALALAT